MAVGGIILRQYTIALILVTLLGAGAYAEESENRGYLDRPPVFVDNFPDFPLAGMALVIPNAGQTLPDADAVNEESNEFVRNGVNVQPNLNLKTTTIRLGALHGLGNGWAAGLSLPWERVKVRGKIGGEPATATVEAFGDLALLGKKRVWQRLSGESLVVSAGLELPTGKDNATFDQSNSITNGYYHGYPRRMPLSWQPGSGTVDGYLALAYGKTQQRLSYVGILATKLHSAGDENVKIGDIFIGAADATYGISRKLALSLGMVLRSQADDEYPQAPPPGVDSPALAGTTQHGTTFYLDPSIRYVVANRFVVGFGLRYPIVKPDDGMVPQVKGFIIFYPNL